jgi:hypothetical protein
MNLFQGMSVDFTEKWPNQKLVKMREVYCEILLIKKMKVEAQNASCVTEA